MNSMKLAVSPPGVFRRIFAAVLATPFAVLAFMAFRTQLRAGFDPLGATFASANATVALIGFWYALRGQASESRMRIAQAMRGALILGAIGFLAGFFGPLIFVRNANQGPLLGIFFTGPLGLVLGAVIGWLYGHFHRPKPLVE